MGEGGSKVVWGGGAREIQFYSTRGTGKYSFAVPFSILTLVETSQNNGKSFIEHPMY